MAYTDEKSIKAKVINTSRGVRGVRPEGGYVHLEPGAEHVGRFHPAELLSARETDGLQVVEFEDAADDDLSALTVADLKALAETESVDLGDATKKAEIIAAIEAKRSAAE